MKSRLRAFVLASAAIATAAMATLPAVAATSTTLNVPFSFTVNGRSLPAGEYSVMRDDTGNFVRLTAKDASYSHMWVANPSAANTGHVVLKFDAENPAHALQSVQYGALVTSRLDRKSRKHEDITPQIVAGQ